MANLIRYTAVALLLITIGRLANGNQIVTENQHTGSPGWLLNKPGNDTSLQIKGYASAASINHGESIDFHITVSPAQDYTIEIYRLGYYGGTGGRLMTTIGPLAGTTQAQCPVDATTGMIRCSWPVSYTLDVPPHWVTGAYVAKLINAAGYQNYLIFTVRDDDRNPDLIFQSSVMTYHAYNNFPNDGVRGKSSYEHNSYGANTVKGSPEAVKLSFDRPYNDDGSGQIFSWEHDLIRYLEQQGYDVSYTTNIDTHAHPEQLLDAKGFLSTGHDEYWSGAMYEGIEVARDAGVNLAFFGANAAFWQVRMEASDSGVPNRVMVIYKEAGIDPEPDPLKKTVLFRSIGRPEQRLVGLQSLDWNDWDKNTGFVAQDTSHWIYNGTGLDAGSVIPGIIGYEVDSRYAGYLMPDSVSYTVLARSPYTGKNHGSVMAETAIYETQQGSQIFASGTMSWSWGLNRTGIVNPDIRIMTKNLLDRFVGPAPVPAAPAVTNPGALNSRVGDVISLTVAASDPQGDPLTFSVGGLPDGLSIASSGGVISGTVDAAAIGSHNVSIHVSDGTQTTTVNFIWVITASPELASCGAPAYNPSLDPYLYLWKECGTDNWHVLLSGGGTSYVNFSGTIESTAGFVSVINDGSEPGNGDIIDTSDPNALKFSFTTGDIYTDALIFIPQIGTRMCFIRTATTTQVRVGNGARLADPPFDPATSQACYQLNSAPLLSNPGAQTAVEGSTVSLGIVASDAENNPLTYAADALPPGLTIGAGTGVISGAVAIGSAGIYNVSVHVSDGLLTTTVNFDWAISPPNTAPQVTHPGAQSATEGDVILLAISATDRESNTLGYSADGLPPGLDIAPDTGAISGTVGGASADPYTVSVHVSDGLLTTTVVFAWTVNPDAAPTVINPGDQASMEGDLIFLGIIANDDGGNPLDYSADGLPPGLDIDPNTGEIRGTAGGARLAPYNVSVHVSDGALTTTVDFTWSVDAAIQPDGDINEDGIVNVADLLLAQRAVAGQIMLTGEQMLHADVAPLQNGIPAPDGQFTLGDVLVIERLVLIGF
jgi:hypothetical protein